MELATKAQVLDEAISILLHANAVGKGMNLFYPKLSFCFVLFFSSISTLVSYLML